ncbi:MAG: methyltransferase domain-containing protein [Wenzhouxiangellaceae bacterium]|nr:methyltransferase domain-containing protein [Wenzhouxiangellaceae bacterium]
MNDATTASIRARFDALASDFARHDALQRAWAGQLLERLDGLKLEPLPKVILDLGCGPVPMARALAKRFRAARVVAIDASRGMLAQARRAAGWRQRRFRCVQADARRLPLADDSVDLVFAHLLLPWIDDVPGLLTGLRRVLRPEGLLLLSALGPDTAAEGSAGVLDPTVQVSDVQRLGDALMRAGFHEPVLDTDWLDSAHASRAALHRQLAATGLAAAGNEPVEDAPDGPVRMRWEVVQASAWAPPHGAPIRSFGGEEASVPISQIGRRQR